MSVIAKTSSATTLPKSPEVLGSYEPVSDPTLKAFAATLQAAGLPAMQEPPLVTAAAKAPPLLDVPHGVAGSAAPSQATTQSPAATDPKVRRDPHRIDDPLDPLTRQAAQLEPPPGALGLQSTGVPAIAPSEVSARASLEELLPALVRRIAWSGDGRKGTMRLELGAGPLAGATLVIHSDEGRVRVELNAPAGQDKALWRERISARLDARGIHVDSSHVD